MVILTVRVDVHIGIVRQINALYSYGEFSHKLLLFLNVVD